MAVAKYGFEFDTENGLLRVHVTGDVSDAELRTIYDAIGKCVERVQPRSGIVDFSGVTSFRVSAQTIRALAASKPPMPDPKAPRFVVAPADHVFAMSRLFEMEGERTRPSLRVVRTIEEAYEALGIREAKFNPVGLNGWE